MSENDVKMITVGGRTTGMLGLDEIFTDLKAADRRPSDEIGATLLELAGRRNYIPPSARAEYAKALLVEYRRFLGEDVPRERSSTLSVKILGAGCHRCETLTANVRSALAELGLAADVEHVRDVARIGEYGVLGTPALVVNGEVKSIGKTLTTGQVVALLRNDEDTSRGKT